ncbi:MAG: biotin--[acetyl-CoA-carboxylase] ligase [Alphaproteobacteria bacterium]|nr:biotin--[acetyl-CoA-carboxylase] ligase [Alphaproteobacteria bacterium]
MSKLEESAIKSGLSTDIDIIVLDKTESTNDYFIDIGSSAAPSICLAEQQLKGKGRSGRSWYSPYGSNIYLSLFYKFSNTPYKISSLSLVIGLAVREAISRICGNDDDLCVKWPNDIFYKDKKLAGILVESKTLGDEVYVTAGIGINVNLDEDTNQIDNAWTSIKKMTGHEHDRNILVIEVVNNILSYYKEFEVKGFGAFMSKWLEKDLLQGKEIILSQVSKEIEGKCEGVDDIGNLLIRMKDGSLQKFNYGDTTILGFKT